LFFIAGKGKRRKIDDGNFPDWANFGATAKGVPLAVDSEFGALEDKSHIGDRCGSGYGKR